MELNAHVRNATSLPILLFIFWHNIQYPAVMGIFALLMVIVRRMGKLKYVYQVCGEQFVVTNSGIVSMLVLFADSWDFHNMVFFREILS